MSTIYGAEKVNNVSPGTDSLFRLIPNILTNVTDPSALVQLVFRNDLRENLSLLSALSLPLGADGTEFGGASSGIPNLYLSTGPSASVQLMWYW